jgi:transposase-like protein
MLPPYLRPNLLVAPRYCTESRIPASERTSQKLNELLSQGVVEGDARSELIKLAVRKIVEEALEAEVGEAVGRGYYENGAAPGAGYRNGYRRSRLRTAEGAIEYGVPQVADRAEPFVSRVRAGHAGRTAELEQLAVEMYARGLSTRDIEAAFRDASGTSVLSRTAVSQITERLWQEYEAFAGRDLSESPMAYFFVDGVAERLHAGLPREAVLCAWGITDDGRKVLVHLAPGTKEDTASCTGFFEDLKRRGLADPLLVVTDGAPGLIRAAETCFPRALRQRCLVHRLRNLRSKAPENQWPEIALRARGCYEAASPRAGRCAARRLRRRVRAGAARGGALLPRRLRGVHRPPALPAPASTGDPHHEFARAALPRRAPSHEDHPARLRRAPGAEADVCRRHPRGRPVARPQRRRV